MKKQLAAHADALGEIYAALVAAESPRKARGLDLVRVRPSKPQP